MNAPTVRLPRASATENVVDTLLSFHETMRSIAGWAAGILDERGAASARDAGWLREFLRGPLRWHVEDELRRLHPWLELRQSEWLEACLARGAEKFQAAIAAADVVLGLLEPLCAGEVVSRQRWSEAARAFAGAVAAATHYDDDILLPTARLFLDEEELGTIKTQIMASDAMRSWEAVAVVGHAPVLHKVHAVRAKGAGGLQVLRSFAACPRRGAMAVEACAGCPQFDDASVTMDGSGYVACAIDAAPPPTHAVVGDYMTRDVLCVERDLPLIEAARLIADAGITGLPVVDQEGRAVGVISQSDIVDAMGNGAAVARKSVADVMMHAPFVVRESDAIADAARLLVLEGVHRLPVINADRVVVGILSTLDVLRATVVRTRPRHSVAT